MSSSGSSGWERELHVLDQAIRRLSAEYDAFLYGSKSRPPVETRKHVEEMVRRLNASESMSSAERYRFSTLQGRFATMMEAARQEIAAGRVDGHELFRRIRRKLAEQRGIVL